MCLKCCDVSTWAAGAFASLDDEIRLDASSPAQIAAVAPATVKPYAHAIRAHGQLRGRRQSRANESSRSFRKSSVTGFGATALHNSHRSHAAAPISSTPHQRFNARLIAPVL